MRKSVWIIVFILTLAVTLAGIYLEDQTLRMVSKPLLMPVLILFFVAETKKIATPLKAWIILALFFSWVGDILLMFEANNKIYFLLGLSSFLLAHLFYIIFFHVLRLRENIRAKPLLLLLVLVYYSMLTIKLSPSLEKVNMNLPVRIYGAVLSFMFMLAMHGMFFKNKKPGLLMVIGAALFVISDSVLAFNKFNAAINYGDLIVMLTYGMAQLLITIGAIEYINAMKEPGPVSG